MAEKSLSQRIDDRIFAVMNKTVFPLVAPVTELVTKRWPKNIGAGCLVGLGEMAADVLLAIKGAEFAWHHGMDILNAVGISSAGELMGVAMIGLGSLIPLVAKKAGAMLTDRAIGSAIEQHMPKTMQTQEEIEASVGVGTNVQGLR